MARRLERMPSISSTEMQLRMRFGADVVVLSLCSPNTNRQVIDIDKMGRWWGNWKKNRDSCMKSKRDGSTTSRSKIRQKKWCVFYEWKVHSTLTPHVCMYIYDGGGSGSGIIIENRSKSSITIIFLYFISAGADWLCWWWICVCVLCICICIF